MALFFFDVCDALFGDAEDGFCFGVAGGVEDAHDAFGFFGSSEPEAVLDSVGEDVSSGGFLRVAEEHGWVGEGLVGYDYCDVVDAG